MKSVVVNTKPSYSIDICNSGISRLGLEIRSYLEWEKVLIITDSTVNDLYADSLFIELDAAGFYPYKYVLAAGEESKSLGNYCKIIERLATLNFTRTDGIIALGGGVVGDISGFAASTYMRGIDYVQIPTTLLACVDSSVGGKTAVDLPQGKNLVGAFYQPKKVFIRTELLKSLPKEIIQDGMGEVLKYAILEGGDLLDELKKDTLDLEKIIELCVDIKRVYVESDERDIGVRQMLNLGHTFGHAYERMNNYGVSHGSSVAIGLRYALEISKRVGLISNGGDISELLGRYGVEDMPVSISTLAKYMQLDKKNFNGSINFVLIKDMGKCILYPMTINQLLALSDKVDINNYAGSGVVKCIKSKSYCHRAIIMASRAVGKTTIHGVPKSVDVIATISAIECLGANVKWLDDDSILISPIAISAEKSVLNVKESGSTMRFMLPQIASLGITAEVFAEGRLPERTNAPLVLALREHGAQISDSNQPICLAGKLEGGRYRIAGDISSQYISGLIMALATLKEDSMIELATELESADYVEITLEVMGMFGVKVTRVGNVYSIKGGQTIKAICDITIEADWSNSAPWLVIGAVCGGITLEGLNRESKQGDRIILDILKDMGAKFEFNNNTITTQKSALKAIDISAKDCLDLVPALAVACAAAEGVSRIRDVKRLRLKESDRIIAVIDSLKAIGINAAYDGDIVIHGGKIMSGTIDSHNDHRIVMLATIAGCISQSGVTLTGARSIAKSYPEFFNVLRSIGGSVNAW